MRASFIHWENSHRCHANQLNGRAIASRNASRIGRYLRSRKNPLPLMTSMLDEYDVADTDWLEETTEGLEDPLGCFDDAMICSGNASHLPVNFGGLFWTKASIPSRASGSSKQRM